MAVTAVVNDDTFDIALTGLDSLWAFKRRLTLPIDVIVSTAVVPRRVALGMLRWRMFGTYLPRVVCAGHFTVRTREGRAFVSTYRSAEVLAVNTRIERPRLVLLQHPSAHDLAWYLGQRIGRPPEQGLS